MRQLLQHASDLGVTVHVAHFDDDPTLLGYYNHEQQAIVLRFGLTPIEMRSVLAHELAHAFYGDICSAGLNERRASRRAAQLLISPEAYAAAEAIDPAPSAIAEELQVTTDLIDTYQEQCLQRLGKLTYGRAWGVGLSGELPKRLSS